MGKDYSDIYYDISSTEGGLPVVGINELLSEYDEDDLAERIYSMYVDAAKASQLSNPPEPQEVYITGSFAREDAEILKSDLDVRVVVSQTVSYSYTKWVRDFCKKNGQKYLKNKDIQLFSVVDLWVLDKRPTSPSYRVD